MRIGIDVGGTFTDIVLVDDRSGQVHYTKVLTTHHDLAEGVVGGIDKILHQVGAAFGDVDYLVHGTTIGTNALIERKGARTGLITTEGFRDVLEIARIERPDAGLYDMNVDLPAPLVPRALRLEVAERVSADGRVVRPFDEASARHAAAALKAAGVEAVAVAFLFSFRNPDHEQRMRAILQEVFPQASVSLSSEIAPEFREFERTSTTVINAYLQPVVDRYLDNLEGRLKARYGAIHLRILQASGGAITVEAARGHAVNLVNSGPAGGAQAAALVGRLTGDRQLISVDMGGTSFDIGLIDGGEARVTSEGEFEGYPVKIPVLDVHAIGAGGGSIAWLDVGGALNVGPMSARSQPGPACYDLGGEKPTVTDANLVLGRLNPAYFLGGEMQLHPDLARRAIERDIARPLGLSVEEAASGIIRVVNANMVRGISVNSIEKGYDVREFSLVPFGGAGPLHAVELAQDLGMRRVIVPPYPGTFSALGLLVADTRYDYVRTLAKTAAAVAPDDLLYRYEDMEILGRAQLERDGVASDRVEVAWSADLRYEGQSYELNVPVAHTNGHLSDEDIAETVRRFHALHQKVYAYGSAGEAVEFVNLRLAAYGRVTPLQWAVDSGQWAGDASQRQVYFQGQRSVGTAVYRREALGPRQVIAGPCLVEEIASTTVIPPGAQGEVDPYGNIVVTW
jgi:N-methylhydantoinase A